MACVLFSRPDHDVTLAYLHHYSKELVKHSLSLSHKTIDKEKQEATKKNILNVIQKKET